MLLLLPLLLLPLEVWAACTGSSPTWSSTPDYASVNSCLGSATSGDTINVSAGDGTETWASTLTITKGIYIKGPGSGSLTVTGSSNPMIVIQPVTDVEVELTGFTFNTNNSVTVIQLWGSNTEAAFIRTKANIHNNAFVGISTPNSSRYYIDLAGMGGVVWQNTFSGAWQYFVGHFDPWGTDQAFTLYDSDLNTTKALYFEDNIFTKTETSDNYIQDCQFSGLRVVWRYNTWNIPGDTGTAIDWHGYSNASYNSCQGYLVYGNQFNLTNNGSMYSGLLSVRGGRGLAFYNNVTSTGDVITIGNCNGEYGCALTYTDHQITRQYNWNNRQNLTTLSGDMTLNGSTISCDGKSNYPLENWNFFNYKTSFNGTVGVGCGTLASRPATCTARVAYWATNQSCANVTGLVGDIITNPSRTNISGNLYVCTATDTWTEWGALYTYPHPLRMEGGGIYTETLTSIGVFFIDHGFKNKC